jgi:hypothetical protein
MRLEWNLTVAGMGYKSTIRWTNYCHFYSYLLCQKVAWSNFPIFLDSSTWRGINLGGLRRRKRLRKLKWGSFSRTDNWLFPKKISSEVAGCPAAGWGVRNCLTEANIFQRQSAWRWMVSSIPSPPSSVVHSHQLTCNLI